MSLMSEFEVELVEIVVCGVLLDIEGMILFIEFVYDMMFLFVCCEFIRFLFIWIDMFLVCGVVE